VNLHEVIVAFPSLLEKCRALGLPRTDCDNVQSLVEAFEPGVAVEILCDQLFEHDIVVPASILKDLARVGESMGIASHYWTDLRSDPAR
jgi:hypothetical protein